MYGILDYILHVQDKTENSFDAHACTARPPADGLIPSSNTVPNLSYESFQKLQYTIHNICFNTCTKLHIT